MRTFDNVDALTAAVGEELGTSNWLTVTQDMIDTFAEATGDHQWIHVDPQKAAKGPFGTTIAHGYLTLSLLPVLLHEVYAVDNIAMGMNYGANKVRFPSPVPVDSRVRVTGKLLDAKPISLGTQFVLQATIELEGSSKPACVAEVVYIYAGKE